MRIAKAIWVFVAVLFISLAATVPADAQEVTCGWCAEGNFEVILPDGSEPICWGCHAFPWGGNLCGWDGHDWPQTSCARCGGNPSFCHHLRWDGPCHIPCGPDGGLVAELSGIQGALDQGDVAVVASALLRERTDASLEYIPEAGRISVLLACSPDRVGHVIPVSPTVREKLEAELLMRAADIEL